MAIRPRISDPYGAKAKQFERILKEGRPPSAPKKPSAVEREPVMRALKDYPLTKRFERHDFFRKIADYYAQEKFEIWGQTIYIMPGYIHLDEVYVRCTEPTIGRVNPNRHGVRPMLRLKGEARTWYSQVLHWIEDTEFDGEF